MEIGAADSWMVFKTEDWKKAVRWTMASGRDGRVWLVPGLIDAKYEISQYNGPCTSEAELKFLSWKPVMPGPTVKEPKE